MRDRTSPILRFISKIRPDYFWEPKLLKHGLINDMFPLNYQGTKINISLWKMYIFLFNLNF